MPNTDTVKVTLILPADLKVQLDRYAEVYSTTWGQQVDAATLIPRMLAQFIARDPGFRAVRKRSP
jgi:hypothetical protein